MSTDRDWVQWGERDPYFAVLTQSKYRASKLDETARREFFDEGRAHVAHVIATVQRVIAADFTPRRALDFGCGVGRVAIPLAELDGIDSVVGVDIAPAMLEEAARNCPAPLRERLSLVLSDVDLSRVTGRFDLVHSCIVLQHIPPARGLPLLAGLLDHVEPDGVAVIQIHYARNTRDAVLGRRSPLRRAAERVGARVAGALTALQRRHADPVMEMHPYNLDQVMFLFQNSGFAQLYLEFTDHGGALGAVLYGRRARAGDLQSR